MIDGCHINATGGYMEGRVFGQMGVSGSMIMRRWDLDGSTYMKMDRIRDLYVIRIVSFC